MTTPQTLTELADELEGTHIPEGRFVHFDLTDERRNLIAAALRSAAVPQGWKLVPVRPTDVQMNAGLYQSSADATYQDVWSIYADMIDASPSIDDHPDNAKAAHAAVPQGVREALETARDFIDPDRDPPRIANREIVSMLNAALSTPAAPAEPPDVLKFAQAISCLSGCRTQTLKPTRGR